LEASPDELSGQVEPSEGDGQLATTLDFILSNKSKVLGSAGASNFSLIEVFLETTIF
jgi:hypothetical protein